VTTADSAPGRYSWGIDYLVIHLPKGIKPKTSSGANYGSYTELTVPET